jgi:hypothetical protein
MHAVSNKPLWAQEDLAVFGWDQLKTKALRKVSDPQEFKRPVSGPVTDDPLVLLRDSHLLALHLVGTRSGLDRERSVDDGHQRMEMR